MAFRTDKTMDPKHRPHHDLYLRVLRGMTPEQRLAKAFELGEMGKELLRAGLRLRNPGMSEEVVRTLALEAAARCHNRNY